MAKAPSVKSPKVIKLTTPKVLKIVPKVLKIIPKALKIPVPKALKITLKVLKKKRRTTPRKADGRKGGSKKR